MIYLHFFSVKYRTVYSYTEKMFDKKLQFFCFSAKSHHVHYFLLKDPCPDSSSDYLRCLLFVPLWLISITGNLSCHQLLRDLKLNNRGKKVIPYPDPKRSLTILYNFVSCPNYFYEVSEECFLTEPNI